MSEIFIQTFFLYFIVIDPLGNTPLFLSITQHMETKQKIKVAFSATVIASIILLFFALLGSSLKLFTYFVSCFYNRWRNNFINNCNRDVI